MTEKKPIVMLHGLQFSKECIAHFAEVPRFKDMYISGEVDLSNPIQITSVPDYKLGRNTKSITIKCGIDLFADIQFGEYYEAIYA